MPNFSNSVRRVNTGLICLPKLGKEIKPVHESLVHIALSRNDGSSGFVQMPEYSLLAYTNFGCR